MSSSRNWRVSCVAAVDASLIVGRPWLISRSLYGEMLVFWIWISFKCLPRIKNDIHDYIRTYSSTLPWLTTSHLINHEAVSQCWVRPYGKSQNSTEIHSDLHNLTLILVMIGVMLMLILPTYNPYNQCALRRPTRDRSCISSSLTSLATWDGSAKYQPRLLSVTQWQI